MILLIDLESASGGWPGDDLDQSASEAWHLYINDVVRGEELGFGIAAVDTVGVGSQYEEFETFGVDAW